MLIQLSGHGLRPTADTSDAPFIGRLTEDPGLPQEERVRAILRIRQPVAALPPGFLAYLLEQESPASRALDAYVLAPQWHYLSQGDIVRIDPQRRALNVLYRRTSRSNTFLVTERCDNYCLMCSQPPKLRDDSWLLDELMEVIPLVDPETREIGITGGEPGLLGERLLLLLDAMKSFLPQTAVHILSNGRSFAKVDFADALGRLAHPDLMLGIPLYSDLPEEHDFVVQAHGAYEDTIAGILNLKRVRVAVELRFVILSHTCKRLTAFARFVARNLRFVDHVALMGLELVGFAKANLGSIWVDPVDYQDELAEAVRTLDRAGIRTSIYNHPLCLLPEALHPFARQSISDWKNLFFEECTECVRRDSCGGFFASATVQRSRGIRALK